MKTQALFTLTLSIIWVSTSSARPTFPTLIPNNNLACSMCHDGAPNSDTLNDIGLDVQSKLVGQNFTWTDVCPLDSDGDGFSNGVELQDLDCTWTPGNPPPGDPALVTDPSDFDSKPSTPNPPQDSTDSSDDDATEPQTEDDSQGRNTGCTTSQAPESSIPVTALCTLMVLFIARQRV